MAMGPRRGERSRFYRYRDLEFIGEGRSSHVYRAHDEALGRVVALKVFADHDAAGMSQSLRQVLTDFALRSCLSSESIARPDRLGWQEELHSSSCLVDAVDLPWMLANRGLPNDADGEKLIRRFVTFAAGLAAQGCYLFDVQPHNLMFRRPLNGVAAWDDIVHFDFGLCAVTSPELAARVGRLIGYAPELMSSQDQERRLAREVLELLYFAVTLQDGRHRYSKRLEREHGLKVRPVSVRLQRPELRWSGKLLDDALGADQRIGIGELARQLGCESNHVTLSDEAWLDAEQMRRLLLVLNDRGKRVLVRTSAPRSAWLVASIKALHDRGIAAQRVVPLTRYDHVHVPGVGSMLQHVQKAAGAKSGTEFQQIAAALESHPVDQPPWVFAIDDAQELDPRMVTLIREVPQTSNVLFLMAGREGDWQRQLPRYENG